MYDIRTLAERALLRTKQASEDAVPTAFGNHGAGMMNPDPSHARAAIMGEMRASANRQNYLDGQTQGTNLIPYKGVLSERYQTISNAINNVQMNSSPEMAKTASDYQRDFVNDMSSRQVEIDGGIYPLFDNYVPDSPEMFEQIIENALNKTASETSMVIAQMINNGQIPEELIPYLQ